MDRMQEFHSLFDQPAPAALEHSVQRARARYQNSRAGRRWRIPLASLGGVAAAFVLLVNFSLPFARACGGIPVLRELACAVALSPSLKAAVEHDYVQPVGQKQTVNGVTMTVEYLIVDQKQINVFYTLVSKQYPTLEGDPSFTTSDGVQAQASVNYGGSYEGEELRKITADFSSGSVPDTLVMEYTAWPSPYQNGGPAVPVPQSPPEEFPNTEPVAAFSFTLRLDPAFTDTGSVYELNQAIHLDGQTLTVKTVEIYPTHVRLNLADHPENTAWLQSLDFYLEDEKGNRYEKITNGITATGDPGGTRFTPSHRLESSYFGDTKHLTVHITGAAWLDKGREYIELDIPSGTAANLPQGVTLSKVVRRGEDTDVLLVAQGRNGGSYSVLYDGWLDSDGGRHDINSVASSPYKDSHEIFGVMVPAGSFYETFTLQDCLWDQVRLSVSFSRYGDLDVPVSFAVK